MANRRFDKVVPVRVSRRDDKILRKWARRERAGNVSEVVRDLIEERRRRESPANSEREDGLPVPSFGVAA